MATNTIQEGPPIDQKVLEGDTGMLTNVWTQWLDKFHWINSTRNHQTITAANAINLDATYVRVKESSGGYAITLAAPTKPGVWKTIEMTTRSAGTVTLALTNVTGGTASTTASFDAVGESLILLSRASKWEVIKEAGGVTLS